MTLTTALLIVAAAILLHPFADRVAARVLPRPNRSEKVLLGLIDKLKPKIDAMLGLGEAAPVEGLVPCGDHHEVFNPGEDRTETHHCILAPGHPDDHMCGCGATWEQKPAA